MHATYILFEHATGYCLFQVDEFEEIAANLPQVIDATNDPSKFKKIVHLVGFKPFTNAAVALSNINAVSEGLLTEELSAFLETNMPKKKKSLLGVTDPKLGAAINEALGIQVSHTGAIPEVLRGIRSHLHHFVQGLSDTFMMKSELGLGHSYSRGKVKFNVNRVDNMIIQSIALIDQLDKDINTFAMRIREWYSYHFPELAQVVTDNHQYAICANFIKNRTSLSSEDALEKLEAILMDSAKAQAILDVARMSMGMDISVIDLKNIERFAKRVVSLAEYRKKLALYLKSKMSSVAPNLSALIGEVVGARLISHAGSLTNLAKFPASTVQILGAEKALFRALKTKSNTPKYGLIYHSSFIGRAGLSNKGRISRCLANKCSLATRIDCFAETVSSIFGEKLKDQVEERLKFYETGDLPRKNIEVMAEATDEYNAFARKQAKELKKKRKLSSTNGIEDGAPVEESQEQTTSAKKKKKRKKENADDTLDNSQEISFDNGLSHKKKNKKIVFDQEDQDDSVNPSAFDITFDESIVKEEQEGSPKKKKKKSKKSNNNDEENMEASQSLNASAFESTLDAEGPPAKKKKKKKSKGSQED